ncbi:hypothetical protein TrLO_g15840 [Triparma laevis f. longispina]|uniref:Uncharacterized protein n=1 Tax=Triparma laevis f. longispina TaxID=1714387 RepID=A0A9W7ED39_9STRA|nr:hypothetical protein TrLO_g15840 [Triparma laevis f. longispina]
MLGFAKGNFDGGLKSVIDDFRLTEETFDEEKVEKIEEDKTDATKPQSPEYGEDLPYTYANLVKNIALGFTFGLASSLTAWIGCIGILFRWLALSFLVERFEKKTEGKAVKTDAQSIPFRCIVLVVICNVSFFGTAAILAGVTVGEEEKGGGVWTVLVLAVMVGALWSQIAVLSNREVGNFFVKTEVKDRGGKTDGDVVSSPMQDEERSDEIELKVI